MIEIYYLDQKLEIGKISNFEKFKDKPLWIDIFQITKEDEEFLNKYFNIHPITIEDLYNDHTRIKVEEFNDYLFCVFYGLEKNGRFDINELNFIIGPNYFITNHKIELKSISELKRQPERIEELFKKGVDFIFHKILDSEIDNYMPVLENFDDEIEAIEELATTHPEPKLLSKILELKREIIKIKKITMPQREKISFLAKGTYKEISKKSLPYFRDIYDNSIRISDAVESYREAIGNSFDAYMSAVSNSMNEVMKVLSIIATIALPLTVISGIYGTNFINLPGSKEPYGFWIMIFLMIMLASVMLILFKRKHWL